MSIDHSIKMLSVSELKEMVSDGLSLHLLDVLPPDNFEAAHLPGAKNACVFYVSFLDDVAAVVTNKDDRIVVYGSSDRSHDAKMAAEKLIRVGYTAVYILEGGIAAWRQAENLCEGNDIKNIADTQTTLSLTDGNFVILNDASTVQWEGRNATTSHVGTVSISKGAIEINDGKLSGKIEIDMNSIKNINLEGDDLQPVLEAHLKSDDFFFTSLFPEAVLTFVEATPTKTQWQTSPNFHVKGSLTLRGVTAEVEFDITVNQTVENELLLEAHFDIDRTRWNIIYGSSRFFEHLGMHKVFDLISLQLRIVAS